MSTAATPRRHALGLPAGSVRATHVLVIVGLICGLLFVPVERNIHVPPFLIYLLFLILGHYFAAHGNNIGTEQASPLHLPKGSIRLLIVLLLGATIGWHLYQDPTGLQKHFDSSLDELKAQPFMPLIVLGGFFLGVVIRSLVGRDDPPQAWQDFEAWMSIMALIGLVGAVIVHLIIGASVQERLSLPIGESILGGAVAFYFGARS